MSLRYAERFVIKPPAFSHQDKLRKLTLRTQSAQARICFNQSNQVLAGLNRRNRENVVSFDAVNFPNFSQFCFIFDWFEMRRGGGRSHGNAIWSNAVSINDVST